MFQTFVRDICGCDQCQITVINAENCISQAAGSFLTHRESTSRAKGSVYVMIFHFTYHTLSKYMQWTKRPEKLQNARPRKCVQYKIPGKESFSVSSMIIPKPKQIMYSYVRRHLASFLCSLSVVRHALSFYLPVVIVSSTICGLFVFLLL